jgi:DNA-binding MarR family transcriptional regulator
MAADRDAVDRIVEEWEAERPDLDASPIAVVGRVSRLARHLERRLAENFAAHGIEEWMYDVLATLRRIGPPHELCAGDLVGRTMVTTGAITNRVDRLVERGLVERHPDPDDRRKVVVRLTPAGLAKVDEVAAPHLAIEADLLAPLSERQRSALAGSLRTLLVHLGDRDPLAS